ncbi:hypothetical protein DMB95_04225 [Campylobacter sp. MIT 12-8780]|uniref:hypothetical protein n=1 Tax=unclassified Campylobacter TaxID=2593542 RepID=UPI00115CBE30|nr:MULTISPECIES: hypothetical protein [unclassified Campylobacter]NDJ27140.1 hypothetical protein [Campylobacter sp. MIT 19-121]TQR41564.1 hypothetical protein DMB95_04225 [Campylobacter sp. MIT 12-8780]
MSFLTNNFIEFSDVLMAFYEISFFLITTYIISYFKLLKEARYATGVLFLFLISLVFAFTFSSYFFGTLAYLSLIYIWIQILRVRIRHKKEERFKV